ncbi:hypothetical protein ACTXT7_017143 [Hymenolepis weldensis]
MEELGLCCEKYEIYRQNFHCGNGCLILPDQHNYVCVNTGRFEKKINDTPIGEEVGSNCVTCAREWHKISTLHAVLNFTCGFSARTWNEKKLLFTARHPEEQHHLPRSVLAAWYQKLFKKGIVTERKNPREFFQPRFSSPMDLPYLVGDHWPDEYEKLIKAG